MGPYQRSEPTQGTIGFIENNAPDKRTLQWLGDGESLVINVVGGITLIVSVCNAVILSIYF